jgi:hypothetical protein
MRDDNHSRNYPPNDPSRRAPAGAGNAQGGDPLAELARLIGQNDPFSDFARDQGRAPAPAHNSRRPDPNSNPMASDWQAHPAPYRDAPHARQAPQQTPHYGQGAPAHDAFQGAPDEQHDYPESYPGEPAPDGQYAPQDYAPPARGFDPQQQRGFDPQQSRGFDPQQFDPQQFDPQQGYGDQRQGSGAYGSGAYGDQRGYAPQNNSFQPPQGQRGYASESYYRGAPHDEDMYEDQPRARRRGGMLTVMAVLALAVIGTAGAFGYRAVFSNAGSVLTPPTIRADAGPNKVVPTSQASDASGKLIYDRVGDKGQPERLVSREEQPADIKTAAPPPRVVLSSGMTNPIAPVPSTPVPPSAPAFAAPPAPAAAAAPGANASTEPKKVRTLTIRPDQPTETASAAPAAAPATRPVPPVEPVPATTTVRTTTVRPQMAQNDPNAPLSLTPNSTAQRGAMRTASAPATQPAATASGSAYAVQVTSQRTEAEAQSSYQALQAKYPGVLGNRQASIRRADLGDKGTYYRAQVPFGSQGEASEFCASLRAAGGQCVVQRN